MRLLRTQLPLLLLHHGPVAAHAPIGHGCGHLVAGRAELLIGPATLAHHLVFAHDLAEIQRRASFQHIHANLQIVCRLASATRLGDDDAALRIVRTEQAADGQQPVDAGKRRFTGLDAVVHQSPRFRHFAHHLQAKRLGQRLHNLLHALLAPLAGFVRRRAIHHISREAAAAHAPRDLAGRVLNGRGKYPARQHLVCTNQQLCFCALLDGQWLILTRPVPAD